MKYILITDVKDNYRSYMLKKDRDFGHSTSKKNLIKE